MQEIFDVRKFTIVWSESFNGNTTPHITWVEVNPDIWDTFWTDTERKEAEIDWDASRERREYLTDLWMAAHYLPDEYAANPAEAHELGTPMRKLRNYGETWELHAIVEGHHKQLDD